MWEAWEFFFSAHIEIKQTDDITSAIKIALVISRNFLRNRLRKNTRMAEMKLHITY